MNITEGKSIAENLEEAKIFPSRYLRFFLAQLTSTPQQKKPANHTLRRFLRWTGISAVAIAVVLFGFAHIRGNQPKPVNPGSVNPARHNAPPYLTSIHMVSDEAGWATGQKDPVLRTEDGGATWRDVTPPKIGPVSYPATLALTVSDTGQAWIARLGNGTVELYGTSDDGAKWTKLSTLTPPKALSSQVYASFVDSRTGWLLTTSGPAAGLMLTALFVTHDGGKTWSRIGMQTLPQGGLYESGLTFASDSCGWITGMYHADFTPLYMTTDGGRSWHRQTVPLPSGAAYVDTFAPLFFGRCGVLPAIYHVGGRGSEVMTYSTDNGGKTWEPGTGVPAGEAEYPHGPAWSFINANQGFAMDGSVIYRTKDAGHHWTEVRPNISLKGMTELDFLTADEGWAIVNGRLLKTTDSGKTWHPVGPSRGISASS